MPLTGHINPMIALARNCSPGHDIIFIGIPDVGPFAHAAGLTFVPYCEEELPAGSSASILAPAAKLHGPGSCRFLPKNTPADGLQFDWSNPPATISRHAAAIVSQTPKEFDLPGIPWPPEFFHTGPFFDEAGREPVPFAWEKLDGRQLVYASLGTLVNGIGSIYRTILSAVAQMPETQVVLPKGSNIELAGLGPIPPNVLVATVDDLHQSIRKVLHTPAYREKAKYFQNVSQSGVGWTWPPRRSRAPSSKPSRIVLWSCS